MLASWAVAEVWFRRLGRDPETFEEAIGWDYGPGEIVPLEPEERFTALDLSRVVERAGFPRSTTAVPTAVWVGIDLWGRPHVPPPPPNIDTR